ncbi:hypothetical protein Taro_030054 [Colocasia esculenta]|uniref:Uncharacterized protein n=1 Tax=Colocasia esculenta TaxID=4460 RepID=A0A843VV06_COLES|nr:hypothetical protein [Colocasia esculenta]
MSVVRRCFSHGCSVSIVVTPGSSFPTSWRSRMLGACVVRLWSHVVAPMFRELLCLGGCMPRCCFRIVFDSAGSVGVVWKAFLSSDPGVERGGTGGGSCGAWSGVVERGGGVLAIEKALCCFGNVFDSAGSAGVVFGPTLVVGRGITLFRCFVVLCNSNQVRLESHDTSTNIPDLNEVGKEQPGVTTRDTEQPCEKERLTTGTATSNLHQVEGPQAEPP